MTQLEIEEMLERKLTEVGDFMREHFKSHIVMLVGEIDDVIYNRQERKAATPQDIVCVAKAALDGVLETVREAERCGANFGLDDMTLASQTSKDVREN